MLILFLKNIPFNPSLGLYLSQFIFSIIEKKIKVNISYIVYRISYIGKTVSRLTSLPVRWLKKWKTEIRSQDKVH